MTRIDTVAAFWEAVDGSIVLGLVDYLNSVRIVVRHLRVGGNLRENVDAAIDDPDSVNLQGDRAVGDGSARGLPGLLGEESGKGGAVVPTIGLRPDADLVVLWFVLGEPISE